MNSTLLDNKEYLSFKKWFVELAIEEHCSGNHGDLETSCRIKLTPWQIYLINQELIALGCLARIYDCQECETCREYHESHPYHVGTSWKYE